MKRIRYLLDACFLASAVLAAYALASGERTSSHIRFDWSQPGVPGVITLPLPPGLQSGEVESLSVPFDGRLAGFALEAKPSVLQLELFPAIADGRAFSAVDLRLESGDRRRYEFGAAIVVPVSGEVGPLDFERSLSATAAGLYQAVALRNTGERDLLIGASRYLPSPLHEGRLLVSKGEPMLLLSQLEAAMTPVKRREALRDGSDYPQIGGFSSVPAASLGVRLAPREAVVLAWTDASLPPTTEATSFELRPVIEYRVAPGSDGEASRQLGLPVVIRRWP